MASTITKQIDKIRRSMGFPAGEDLVSVQMLLSPDACSPMPGPAIRSGPMTTPVEWKKRRYADGQTVVVRSWWASVTGPSDANRKSRSGGCDAGGIELRKKEMSMCWSWWSRMVPTSLPTL